jgi:hypothetical protein
LFVRWLAGNLLAFVNGIMAFSGRFPMMSWHNIARWSLLVVVGALPGSALALESVRYRCGPLGEVSVDRSTEHSTKAVVVYGNQRWPGTLSGGSMTFFSPTRQTPESPWMNFGRNGVWLYTNYVGTAGWSEFWAEDASTYRRNHPDFLESSCVMLSS